MSASGTERAKVLDCMANLGTIAESLSDSFTGNRDGIPKSPSSTMNELPMAMPAMVLMLAPSIH
jgi:hypothetical protein